jgi:hypothetical protein
VEAYAAYRAVSARTRRLTKWSATCLVALSVAGQVAYHLIAQAGKARAIRAGLAMAVA